MSLGFDAISALPFATSTNIGAVNINVTGNALTITIGSVGIIADAACAITSTNLFTAVYTVVSGDLGTTLTLNTYANCDTACV